MIADVTAEPLTKAGIVSNAADIATLEKLLVRETESQADHYFDESSGNKHKIVLAEEEPAGFHIRPRNLMVNWRSVMGATLPNAVFATVSAAQLPWLTPFAVLAIIWDARAKMVVPLKPEHAIVLRAVYECGAHATEPEIVKAIAKRRWQNPQTPAPIDVTTILDQLSDACLVELIDGKAHLIDDIVIEMP